VTCLNPDYTNIIDSTTDCFILSYMAVMFNVQSNKSNLFVINVLG
jgi:hypothetical protein